ncbi:MAG TPA: hypothetical protein VNL98_07305 [Gemmatimonadales bacterium]|nr:hypothetical protein [Gemmatimonadales bacterium]
MESNDEAMVEVARKVATEEAAYWPAVARSLAVQIESVHRVIYVLMRTKYAGPYWVKNCGASLYPHSCFAALAFCATVADTAELLGLDASSLRRAANYLASMCKEAGVSDDEETAYMNIASAAAATLSEAERLSLAVAEAVGVLPAD